MPPTSPDPIPAILARLDRLERSLRLWKRLALACASFLALALLANHAPTPLALAQEPAKPAEPAQAGSKPEDEPEHIRLAKRRLALSRQALDIINNATRKNATMVNMRDYLYRWSYRLLGDQIYLSLDDDDPRVPDPEVYLAVLHAKPSRERTLAFEAHRERLLTWERMMRPLYEQNFLSPIDFMDIQSYRLEADLWLARERMKEAGATRDFGPQPPGPPRDPAEPPAPR